MPGPAKRRKRDSTCLSKKPSPQTSPGLESLYRQAIAAADGVVYQLDFTTNTYTFMSDGIERLLGYPAEEVTPQIWARIGTLDRQRGAMIGMPLQEAVRQFREGTLPVWTADYKVTAKNGETRWVSDSSVLLKDKKGKTCGCLGILQDITAQRMLEERLRQSEKMEAVGQLAGGIAHDFNNILTGIMGNADMICMDPHNEKVVPWAEMISRAALRASDLTGKLLAFARKGKYRSVPVNMHATVADVVALLEHSMDKRIAVRQILQAHPPVARGDATQLQGILLNLAINARDAMPEGGVLTFSTVRVNLDRATCARQFAELEPGDYLRVSVSDTGIGMDEDVRRHLFEPFFTTKTEGKGTGLGLAAVYGAVRNHSGAIRVETAPGQGSSFHVYLPALNVPPDERGAEKVTSVIHGSGMILVVDDEEVVRAVSKTMLGKLGYKVISCASGEEAVREYAQHSNDIDLVILDLMMPGMGGGETFAELRKINPGIRALLASGYSLDGEAQALLTSGILGYIQKPFKLSELSHCVSSCLRK